MSVCDDSINSIPREFSNVDHETPYCNLPETGSVSVQETTHYDVPHGHLASREPVLENTGFNTNLGMRQMSTSRSVKDVAHSDFLLKYPQ